MINRDRLWQSHMEMAKIGATPAGGVCRLALSDEDKVSRDLFISWAREAGCTIRIDRVGNIFARRAGTDPSSPPVITGSHLDTQPLGGRFDGAYGVLAGLEVVRTLNDAGTETRAPIDIVVWTDEEGCRFSSKTMGSMVFAGKIDEDEVRAATDPDGKSFGAELERIGYAGSEACGGFPIKAYFENHIEQGPLLEQEGIPVGAVVGAQGQRCFLVTVTGEEGHAGTVPMDQRKDSFLGAARMADAINRAAFQFDPPPVATVAHVRVRPNSRNTISGETVFTIDSRYPDADKLLQLEEAMSAACKEIADNMGLGIEIARTSIAAPVQFNAGCVDAVRRAAEARDIPCMDVYSGAGHDACKIADLAPTGMIFVPCERGISHNEAENATPDDLAAGTQVLLDVVVEAANAD
ncbi:MAG: Zn-dependent hydrolase [Rhodospirillaceae bacterium]|jgi:beta-ureidopropionase / N-carbamoyl-L-amino-acid hydrolase|nr:Zn-dependent hydrolase [Rhodospirillaceae bacterium]